jgi:hypothetical protein
MPVIANCDVVALVRFARVANKFVVVAFVVVEFVAMMCVVVRSVMVAVTAVRVSANAEVNWAIEAKNDVDVAAVVVERAALRPLVNVEDADTIIPTVVVGVSDPPVSSKVCPAKSPVASVLQVN